MLASVFYKYIFLMAKNVRIKFKNNFALSKTH